MSEDPKSEGLNVREQNPKSDPKAGVRGPGVRGLKSMLRKLSPEEQVVGDKQQERPSKDSGEENKGHGSGSGMVKIALVALMILGGGVVLRKCGDDVLKHVGDVLGRHPPPHEVPRVPTPRVPNPAPSETAWRSCFEGGLCKELAKTCLYRFRTGPNRLKECVCSVAPDAEFCHDKWDDCESQCGKEIACLVKCSAPEESSSQRPLSESDPRRILQIFREHSLRKNRESEGSESAPVGD